MRILTIIGPMRGLPAFNYPAFDAAAKRWRDAGWCVFNPTESFGGRTDYPIGTYMRSSVAMVLDSDAVVRLPGWEQSVGAQAEHAVAVACGLEVLDDVADPPKPVVA